MPTKKIPEGYSSATPWIISHDTAKLLEFVEQAFGGREIARVLTEEGAVGHA